MGRTKALIEVAGTPMALRVADALRGANCQEVVLIGGDANELAPLGLPVVPDRHPGAGPLGGVLTALERADPHDRVAVVACDLPGLDAAVIVRLFDALGDSPDDEFDAAFARTDRRESLCAVWRAAVAPRLRVCFDRGERAVYRSAQELRVVEIDVHPGALRNVNTPGDLADGR